MSSGYSFTLTFENKMGRFSEETTHLFLSENMEKESYKVRFRKMIKQFRSREDDDHYISKNILYNNSANNTNTKSQTKKRNYLESFGDRDYELERYGQEITSDFFQNNIGHGVIG